MIRPMPCPSRRIASPGRERETRFSVSTRDYSPRRHCYHNQVSLYDLDPGPDCPAIVRMIVEIPKNSTNKYEYDGKLGVFRLDRTLYSPMHYPGDYGFVPGTLAEDGDPLDVLVLVDEPSYPGVLIAVRPLGVLK